SVFVQSVFCYIYHPKLYVFEASQSAVIIIGSANLTRDGLYRNVELATAITLDLTSSADQDVYKSYNTVLDELLNVNNPNLQPINKVTLKWLEEIPACENDIETPDSLAPKSLFEKYQAASRLSINRVIATYTNVSLVPGNSS